MGEQAALDKVDAALVSVAVEITAVEEELRALGAEISEARAQHDKEEVAALRAEKEQLRAKEAQLRAEKAQLRAEKEQLRAKEAQLREKELVLLKTTAETQQKLASIPEASCIAESLQRLELLQQQQLQPTRPDVSLSAMGLRALEVLQECEQVEVFTGDEAAGASVLSAEQLALLAGCSSETEVVKHLTPVLRSLRASSNDTDDSCSCVLVNSENFCWLDDTTAPLPANLRLKPDLFMAPRICVEVREGTQSQGSGDSYTFGRLAHRCLQLDGFVCEVYEAKLNELTHKDFGELVNYQRLIPGVCRGMLFNGRHFWLLATLHGREVHLVKGAWAAPGSASRIRRFFEEDPPRPRPQPLLPLLRHLLSALRVRPAPESGMSFLGAGGSGRVFAVRFVEPHALATERMALKAVSCTADTHWALSLTREFAAMQRAAALGAPVVPIVPGSLRLLEPLGGGFLLSRCGTPFDATASRAACAAAFDSLVQLHTRGVLHGDARLPNLLRLDRAVAWVDLSSTEIARAEYPEAFAIGRRADASSLARSVLLAAGVQAHPLPAAVAAAVAAYDDASAERVRALVDAIWAASKGQ